MKRLGERLLTLSLSLALCTNWTFAMDMGEPPGGGAPPPGDAPPTQAAIVIQNGEEIPDAEYSPGIYSQYISTADGIVTIDGLNLTNGDYTFNGLMATGPETVVRLQKATIRLSVDSPVADTDTGGAATNIDNGATLYISDSDLTVDGSGRYVTANYNDATLIVNNSTVHSTGKNANTANIAEPFSNEALLISGNARTNFSIGATKTYYFNSTCTAEGWAALSTDSAIGDGLDLYVYNTDGIAENGGYSTYADTNCRVWLYGSRLSAAEIGCIISKSGQIHAYNAINADDTLLQYNEGNTADSDTSILGGRNAVMIHAPDMTGEGLRAADCGSFSAEYTTLGTTEELVSTKDYYDYGEAVGAYIDYVSGSVFLIRSTSANIDLKNVQLESYNNTLVHTVLNSDSMGNFLAAGDGDQVNPVSVTMTNMDVTGNIRHEDYQRRMTVDLENTTLSGNIVSGTMDSWNSTWASFGDVNWVVDDSFDAVYGVALTVGKDAVWNVTGDSSLTSLTVQEGGTINGEITLDGTPLTPTPGETYTGAITVSGDYSVPEEAVEFNAADSAEEDSQVIASAEVISASNETDASATKGELAAEAETTTETGPASDSPTSDLPVLIISIVAIVVVLSAVAFLYKKRK